MKSNFSFLNLDHRDMVIIGKAFSDANIISYLMFVLDFLNLFFYIFSASFSNFNYGTHHGLITFRSHRVQATRML